jgi:hypothetical protein
MMELSRRSLWKSPLDLIKREHIGLLEILIRIRDGNKRTIYEKVLFKDKSNALEK